MFGRACTALTDSGPAEKLPAAAFLKMKGVFEHEADY